MLDTLIAARLSLALALASCAPLAVAADAPQDKPAVAAKSEKEDGAPAAAGAADKGSVKTFDRTSMPKVDPANSIPPEMAFVPAGTPKIGLDKDQILALNLENANFLTQLVASYPAFNNRAIDAFYMDKFEVTNAQWKVYLEATGQKPSEQLVNNYWADGKIPKGHEKKPVVFVSYPEVEKFAAWCLKRIPTEFEWEYAARGADGRMYPWGAKFDEDGKRGGTRANCGSSKGSRVVADVGSFPDGASPFGIQDLCGNVWEWTSSPMTAFDTKTISIDIPAKTGKPKTVTCASILSEKQMVIRGGQFDSNPIALLSAVRQGTEPTTWFNTIGFRCVRDVRPGAEVIHQAIAALPSRRFDNSPIAWADVIATERLNYDDQGLIKGESHFVIAPADSVQREKTGGNLSVTDLMTRAQKSSVMIGLIATSEPILEPRLTSGEYGVGILARDLKIAETQKKLVFPKSGWNYVGRDAAEATAKPTKPTAPAKPPAKPPAAKDDKAKRPDAPSKEGKDSKDSKGGKDAKSGKDGKDAKDPKGEGKEGGEKEPDPSAPSAPEPPAAPEPQAAPEPIAQGAVPVDRSHDALVLIDKRGEVVAAMALDGPPKEVAAVKGLVADPLPPNAPVDSPTFTYRFRLGAAKNKVFEVVVPLRYRPLIVPEGK